MYPTDSIPAACGRILTLAERDPRRAVRLARHAHGLAASVSQTPYTAWATLTLGQTLLAWECFAEAQSYLEQAQAMFTTLAMPAALRDCRFALLRLSRMGGASADLLPVWDALAREYMQDGDVLAAARVRFEQIAALNLLGRSNEALALIATLEVVLAAQGTYADQGRFLRLRAVARTDRGELDAAVHDIEGALACYQELRRPIEIAQTLLERAWLAQRREQFGLAFADLNQALATFQRYGLVLRAAFCTRNLGVVASRLGRFAQALAFIQDARTRFVALDRPAAVAACDLNLGIVAYYVGLFDFAQAAYLRAQQKYETLGSQREVLVAQRNRALVMRAEGRPAAALELLAALEPLAAQIDRLEHAEIVFARGQVLVDLENATAAQAALEEAEQCFDALGNAAAAAECRLEQGWLVLKLGTAEQAKPLFHAAQAALVDRPMHSWRIDYGLGRCAALAADRTTALAHYARASTTVMQLRRRLASEQASSGLFVQARQLYQDALRAAADQRDALAVLALDRQQRALALERQLTVATVQPRPELQAEHTRLRGELRAHLDRRSAGDTLDPLLKSYSELLLLRHAASVGHASDLDTPAFEIQTLRAQLDAQFTQGWTALIYCLLADEIVIVTVGSAAMMLDRVPLDERLNKCISQATTAPYRAACYQDFAFRQNQSQQPWSVLGELGAVLIPPAARKRLHAEHRLLIVPSGALHGLSWAALRLDETWLCEHAVIQLLPGLAHWPTLAARPGYGDAALLLGCDVFGSRAPALPSARASLDVVTRRWPDRVEQLVGAEATRAALLERSAAGRLAGYGLIHIASHGQLLAGRGLLAHLKLADDDLLVDEVAGLRLGAALVVLAACEGAAGDVLPGDEVLSLSWAWLAAGARDVIASLWTLYDRTVLALLEPLYDQLAAGVDAPTALARTQRSLIAQGQAAETDMARLIGSPLIWASLCTLGAGLAARPSAGGTPCR